jgi:wobble nucleotide-excising tRNase
MANEIEPIDESVAKQEVGTALVRASTIEVVDESSWYQARVWRRDLDLLHKRAQKWFKEIKSPMNKAIQTIRDKEKEIVDPAEETIAKFDEKILDFEKHRVETRAQLQRDMQEQARERAQESRDLQVLRLEANGDQRSADELKRQPLFVPNIVLPDDFVPLQGEGRKTKHRVKEEVNLKDLAAAVASGQLPENAIEPNFTVLHSLAEAVGKSGKIAGCEIIEVTTITQRSA